jgi:pyruvate dehydrogenase (quinone)
MRARDRARPGAGTGVGLMAQSVANYMLERLHKEWGVKRIYGYPGDGISGLMGAFHELDGSPEFVQVRHELIASFAACAHAKFTGEVGVCVATSGPGAVQLLNGLYDAKLDHQPVVALVGQQQRVSLGSDWLQEVDLQALLGDVSEFVYTCMAPEQARHLVDRAMRTAISSRGVACVVVPVDVQHARAQAPERAHGSVFSSAASPSLPALPPEEELRRAAEVLNAGKRVAILIGQGAAGAQSEVIEAADSLGAGVAKALNGRAALPDDLSFVTGAIGLLGTKASSDMMGGCDTLLMVGTNFPFADWLPDEGQARGVQIDIDGRLIGMRYPVEVALVGDAARTLRALLPMLERKADRSWREKIERDAERSWKTLEQRAMLPGDPINPQRVFQELSPLLPDGCILTADSGTSANWWARHLKLRAGMQAGISGTLATMGCAVPYALGAKFAHPDRPVIAAVGDGAMQMTGINALVDIAHYSERWENPQCIVLVLNNGDLNEVTWEQRAMAGDPRYDVSQTLPAFPFARYADMLGMKALRVDDPDHVRPAWEEALAHRGPVLYEAVTDPNMPPLPPELRFETVRNMTRAFVRGDPAARDIMRHAVRARGSDLRTR